MVFISEVFPNPKGDDAQGEYIKISNQSNSQISLDGWRVADASGKSFLINDQTLSPYGSLILNYSTTKISLNNTKETLFLYDEKNNLVDKLVYQERVGEDILVRKNPLSGEVIFLPLKERSLADFSENKINSLILKEETSTNNSNDFKTEFITPSLQLKDIFLLGFFVSLILTLIFWILFKNIEKDF